MRPSGSMHDRPWHILALLGCVLYSWLLTAVTADMDERDHNERRLNRDLFITTRYNNLIRPVVNTSDSLQINFTLSLSAIINVDAKNQVIITNVWLQMYWHDYQLVWDPDEYGGILMIKISPAHVWVPDVVLFNNADGKFEVSYNPNCVVNNSGDVYIIPPAIYTSSCTIDVMYFPFDQQECEMKFGSWTFEGKTLVYKFQDSFNNIILTDYMKNGAWDIIDGPGRIDTVNDSITGQPKEMIVYVLKLRRKTLFYTVNLIIPCFLHAMVCLCVFVLPAGGGEKITLVISVLVSLVVFLLMLQKILPPSLTIPLIAKYFLFTFIMNVLEILVTVLIICAHNRTPRMVVMPRWVCWLFLYKLPKYLFMERPDHDSRWQPKSCTPPPSYPATPQVPRANIFLRQAAAISKKKKAKLGGVPFLSGDSREAERVMAWRQKFSQSHSPCLSGATMSSSASGSRLSTDDSPTIEMREFRPVKLPNNSHHCMLRDSGTSHSDDSLDGDTILEGVESQSVARPAQISFRKPIPLALTKQIYSASNAIKFICHQMRNQEDYNTVLDDWKYVAAVLDRLLMIIYVLVSLGGTLGVLVNAPHILETIDQDVIIARNNPRD